MNARCTICKEDLSSELRPHTTPCGHLYCDDCASFHFNTSETDPPTPCAYCRRLYHRYQLIRLYPDYDSQPTRRARPSKELFEGGAEVIEACCDALENVQAEQSGKAVRGALSFADKYVAVVSDEVQGDSDLRTLLKSLGKVLSDIKTKLRELHNLKKVEADRAVLERITRQADRNLEEVRRVAAQEKSNLRKELQRERQARSEKELELQTRLHDARRELELTTNELVESMELKKKVETDLTKTRSEALKYRKKYHVYRQAVEDAKKKNKPARDEDDSLIVLGS